MMQFSSLFRRKTEAKVSEPQKEALLQARVTIHRKGAENIVISKTLPRKAAALGKRFPDYRKLLE